MALTTDSFIAPTGEIQRLDFPGLEDAAFTAAIQAWLDDAEAKTTADVFSGDLDADELAAAQEEARIAWVYHRANAYVARRLYREFSRAEVEDKATQVQRYLEQLEFFRDEANRWELRFDSAIRTEPAVAGEVEHPIVYVI